MKRMYGQRAYVQSAGVKTDMEIDGYSVAVCQELGIELSRHRSRSFEEMQEWGDDLSQFDLIVALSPASQRTALELTRFYHLEVEYWPILDPTGLGESRDAKGVAGVAHGGHFLLGALSSAKVNLPSASAFVSANFWPRSSCSTTGMFGTTVCCLSLSRRWYTVPSTKKFTSLRADLAIA